MKVKTVFVIFAFLFTGSAFAAPKSAKVVGTGDPVSDVQNVQRAVDRYENVILSGSFNFGVSSVVIHGSVKIHGETVKAGSPVTTIQGGVNTFYSPAPVPAPEGEELAPGPVIEIMNIHFDGAQLTPINIGYASGVEIKNTKITNVIPLWGFQAGIFISTMLNGEVPGAITGPIAIKDNEIDFTGTDHLGQSFGVGITYTSGVTIEVKGNTLRQVPGYSVAIGDLLTYENGNPNGGVEVKNNNISTAFTTPVAGTFNGAPDGILVGAVFSGKEIRNVSIKGNYIEANGEYSFGIALNMTPKATVTSNEIVVKDGHNGAGWIAAGILSAMSDDAVIAGNHITIKPSLVSPVADWWGGVGILNVSNGGTITRNRITFDESYTEPRHSNGAIAVTGGSGSTISLNTIEGFGHTAVGIFPPASNNLIFNNDLENFTSWRADVLFAPGASNNLLVGEGGTVLDWYLAGEPITESGNVIIGDWDTAVCEATGEFWAYRP